MSLTDLLLLAVALAMDCFTVSIACGAILRRFVPSVVFSTAVLFAFFQAAMPLLGWLATHRFAAAVDAYGHWLAFLLLFYIGGRMTWQALRPGEQQQTTFRPERLSVQLLLAVATSIDALAVGISMAVTGYTSLVQLPLPLAVIALASLLLSLAGHALGLRFGRAIARRMRPELLGGIILIALAIKVLITK
ncbi:MAG: manganese efflux pump [Prevotella sp.]|nr:manganese efflux pump [Prevotella sp.]